MVRLKDLSPWDQKHISSADVPTFDEGPWTAGQPLKESRIAVVTTAGVHVRGDRPFSPQVGDYRVIPGDAASGDLVMSHVSSNFDRSGFQDDLNVVLPIDRLRELAEAGKIGSVADVHYSFMGGWTHPAWMREKAEEVATFLNRDNVSSVILVPV